MAIGANAGQYLNTGSYNIYVGNTHGNGGSQYSESDTIRIGDPSTQTATYIQGISGVTVSGGVEVFVDSSGQLGTLTSSQRYKTDIHDMGADSEAILALRPVTFRYKPEIDPKGTPQYGLVAEEVEKVSPDLVARDSKNQVYTVRYSAVNAMLLNEFRKQHEHVKEQDKVIADQARHLKDQQREIEALKDRLNTVDVLSARLDALEKGTSNK